MSRTAELLEKVRATDGMKNAILRGIEIYRSDLTAAFTFVTDRAYTADSERQVRELVQSMMPEGFRASVRIVKRVADAELLKKDIYAFMGKRFPAAAAFLKEEDIEVEKTESGARFFFDVASGDQALFTSGELLDEVSKFLSSNYCGAYLGNVRIVDREREEIDLDEIAIEDIPEDDSVPIRIFPITDFKRIDGAEPLPKYATYIADGIAIPEEEMTFCGSIVNISEREYVRHNEKTGADEQKSRFSLSITDGTEVLRTVYFPKKTTLEKVRALKEGDFVVLSGANEVYNGRLSFTTKKINYGRPPEGFEPEPRKGRPVPKAYRTVIPESFTDCTQTGFFDINEKPDDLTKNTFVVFDLETTGLNNNPTMGRMDKIIEIGAVKLIGGDPVEKFSTFVACPHRLPSEIVELTGIKDEDLVGAPTIEQVLPDFFKFCDGCYLVGHNVMFDYRFVRYYGEENKFMFDQKQYDTLTLAQELLRDKGLANYKLDTIASVYGFTFNHHRAFDDALVTAKIFIELIKKRKTLPYK